MAKGQNKAKAVDAVAYECTSPIEHDGDPISVGDIVEMSPEIAEPLVRAGALLVSSGVAVVAEQSHELEPAPVSAQLLQV